MTYLWQEERGKPFYRFQTNESEVARKMKRAQSYHEIGFIDNPKQWIFQRKFNRPDLAKRTLRTLSGKKIEQEEKGLYIAK